MAIIPRNTGYTQTQILEKDMKLNVRLSALRILENSCLLHGESLRGRKVFAKEKLKTNRLLPIGVIPERGVVLFPTCSHENPDCQWFSYYHVKDCKQIDHRTRVEFIDTNTVFYTNVSERAFRAQYEKAARLITKYLEPRIFGKFKI